MLFLFFSIASKLFVCRNALRVQDVYPWEEDPLIRGALASRYSRFSLVRADGGRTRITLNVTRLSGAHVASKLSPVYNCAACARIYALRLSVGARRSEINIVQREALHGAYLRMYASFILLPRAFCCALLIETWTVSLALC